MISEFISRNLRYKGIETMMRHNWLKGLNAWNETLISHYLYTQNIAYASALQ